MRFPLGWNDAHQSLVDEVAEQDAHHPDGEVGLRGQVDDGLGLVAEFQDPALLRSRPEMRLRPLPGRHHGVDQSDMDRASRRRPPLCDRVRPYDRDGIPVEVALPAPVMPRARHARSLQAYLIGVEPRLRREVLAHATDQDRHLVGDDANIRVG
jgi:hypothetical protein